MLFLGDSIGAFASPGASKAHRRHTNFCIFKIPLNKNVNIYNTRSIRELRDARGRLRRAKSASES